MCTKKNGDKCLGDGRLKSQYFLWGHDMKFTCQKIMKYLKSVDLFSGVGGLSLGVAGFAKPLLYCELDKYCQRVLVERMEAGQLDPAPIHGDVCTLHLGELKPDMIVAGFPCQDISSMGLQQGIVEGSRSGLFFQILRLVDECDSIKVLFLENVGNIVKCGLKEVLQECSRRGFNVRWIMRSAGSLGAPHVRKRWFCLAVKDGCDVAFDAVMQQEEGNIWNQEPEKRVTFKPHIKADPDYDDNWVARCQALGNAVVPPAARHAFVELMNSKVKWEALADCLFEYSTDVEAVEYPLVDSGLLYKGRLYDMPKKVIDIKHKVSVRVLSDTKENVLLNFPTPRRGLSHASSLTDRSLHDLPTVLVHSDAARNFMQAQQHVCKEKLHCDVIANVQYIEWMMGFPRDWTKISVSMKDQRKLTHNMEQSENEHLTENCVQTRQHMPGRKRLNGMHVFMKEHPGKDVKQVSEMWRALPLASKNEYSKKARFENREMVAL